MEKSSFTALGTSWEIGLDNNTGLDSKKIIGLIRERLETFENNYSRFRSHSLVSQIAHKAGRYKMPADAGDMIRFYRELWQTTNGKVTPLIGQVLVDAGYDENYSLKPKTQIAPAESWDEMIDYQEPWLNVLKPVQLDFGAAGKGYAIDLVSNMIEQAGFQKYFVNAGGDLRYSSTDKHKLRVGLEDPDNQALVIGLAEIEKSGLAGSAGNRRAWDRFHHIIDPHTATSPSHIKALWVTAQTTMLADGLATALFFTSPAELSRKFDFAYAIVYADRQSLVSENFPGHFF